MQVMMDPSRAASSDGVWRRLASKLMPPPSSRWWEACPKGELGLLRPTKNRPTGVPRLKDIWTATVEGPSI